MRTACTSGWRRVCSSHRYLNLEPVVARAAAEFRKQALLIDSVPAASDPLCYGSTWAIVTDGDARAFSMARPARASANFTPWTDDYSSIFAVLRW